MDKQTYFFARLLPAHDLHLELDILNPLNIIFLSNGLKMSPLLRNPFL